MTCTEGDWYVGRRVAGERTARLGHFGNIGGSGIETRRRGKNEAEKSDEGRGNGLSRVVNLEVKVKVKPGAKVERPNAGTGCLRQELRQRFLIGSTYNYINYTTITTRTHS